MTVVETVRPTDTFLPDHLSKNWLRTINRAPIGRCCPSLCRLHEIARLQPTSESEVFRGLQLPQVAHALGRLSKVLRSGESATRHFSGADSADDRNRSTAVS